MPVVGCHCHVCRSLSPLNKRLRPSGLLTLGDKRFLIDVGPDFREQAIRYGIEDITGLWITHTHYDHIGGLDEVRVFHVLHRRRLPCLCSQETFDEIHHRFHYLFRKRSGEECSQMDFTLLPNDFGQLVFEGAKIDYLTYYQAGMKVTGFRVGSFAYISDIRKYEEKIIEALQGIDILVLSALRYTSSEVHFTINEAIDFSQKVGAKRVFFTHIAHEIEHEEVSAKLPSGVTLAHDGLEIEFQLGIVS